MSQGKHLDVRRSHYANVCVAAKKKAYGPQVIPMLPAELAWYGHKKGMPEPRREIPITRRRAHGPSTHGSDEDDGHDDDGDDNDGDDGDDDDGDDDDIPRIRRRRRLTSTPPGSAVRSPTQSAPGPPKVMYAKKTGTPHRRPSSPNAQRRAHGPSTLRSDDDNDGEFEPDFSTDDDDGDDKPDFNFDEPRTRRRRRSTSTPPDSAVRSQTQSEPGRPKTKYAKKTDTSDIRTLRPRQAQMWRPQELDEQIRRDITRRQEKERAEAEVGYLVPNTGSGKQRSTEAPRTFEIDDDEISSDQYAEAEWNRAIAQREWKPRTKTILRKNVSSGVAGFNARKRSAATEASSYPTAAAPVDRESTQRSHPRTPAAQTSRDLRSARGAPIKAGTDQTTMKAGEDQTTMEAAKESEVPRTRRDVPPVAKKPGKDQTTMEAAKESKVPRTRRDVPPVTKKPGKDQTTMEAAKESEVPRTRRDVPPVAKKPGKDQTTMEAAKESEIPRTRRDVPPVAKKPGKDQTTMEPAKESEVLRRRRDVPPVAKKPKSVKEESDEDTIFLPGLRDLVIFTDDEKEDDDDERIYGHGDSNLRTTAARSSRPKRLNALLSSPSQPSPSQSPRKKRAKKPKDAEIRASLRPANQPPPKLEFTPREVKKLGLEGVAKLEKGKMDPSFDKNAPGYSEFFRHSRYINRTDEGRPSPKKVVHPEHMKSADFYYPGEIPIKQSTPPPPPPPAQQRPQQQHMTPPQAPRRQQQQPEQQRRSMAPAPPRHSQQQRRGTSAVHRPGREQVEARDNGYGMGSNEGPPQASAGPQNPTSRGTPGWASSEWMDTARGMGEEDLLKKYLKKKD